MIRDPSDGSEKGINPNANDINAKSPKRPSEGITPSRENNWGLTSLNRDPKPSTFKPMTPEQLAEHYRTFGLEFRKKDSVQRHTEQASAAVRSSTSPDDGLAASKNLEHGIRRGQWQ